VLHPGQYGYRLNNGAPMATLHIVNEIEGAIHNKKNKKYHILGHQRSVDSIPRNL
jgi:hypothetical protein